MKIILPPGSIVIPLEKAPSGHLVMPIDEFERCSKKKGGTPETSLNLVASFGSKKQCEDECCNDGGEDNTEGETQPHHFDL